MTKRIVRPFVPVLAAAAAMGLCACEKPAARTEPPPPKVSVARPELRQVVDFDPYNGWLQAVESVDVRSRVRGHLDKIHFQDGDLVKKGQLLFELDPRPLQADIDREKDQVKVYEAQWVAATKDDPASAGNGGVPSGAGTEIKGSSM